MQHIAVDLGKMQSQICVRAPSGQILQESKLATISLKACLERQPPSRVILETCAEAFQVADFAIGCGHEVRVVPATLVRSLGVGARRTKTDRRDAQILSEVSCRIDLPSVHLPSDLARERRSLCTMREQLLATHTALINCVRGWARTQLLKIRSGDWTTFPKRARDAALSRDLGLPLYVDRLLVVIDSLTQQIALADKELRELAAHDPTCKALMTIPGVGPVIAMRFVAAVDDVTRFPTAHALQAFLGLTPGENSSADRRQRTGITKAGPPGVRRALVQGAWSLRRARPQHPICLWAKQIEERRGKFIATVAVARKLAGIMYAIWRDGSTYNPSHAARQTPDPK